MPRALIRRLVRAFVKFFVVRENALRRFRSLPPQLTARALLDAFSQGVEATIICSGGSRTRKLRHSFDPRNRTPKSGHATRRLRTRLMAGRRQRRWLESNGSGDDLGAVIDRICARGSIFASLQTPKT